MWIGKSTKTRPQIFTLPDSYKDKLEIPSYSCSLPTTAATVEAKQIWFNPILSILCNLILHTLQSVNFSLLSQTKNNYWNQQTKNGSFVKVKANGKQNEIVNTFQLNFLSYQRYFYHCFTYIGNNCLSECNIPVFAALT